MYISVKDLLISFVVFLGVCMVAAIGALLIIALIRLNKTLKRTGKLLEDNADSIDKTMKQMPALVEHFDAMGESFKLTANKAEVALDAVGGMLTGEAAIGRETSTVQSIVTIADSILQIVLGYFANKEK